MDQLLTDDVLQQPNTSGIYLAELPVFSDGFDHRPNSPLSKGFSGDRTILRRPVTEAC